MEVFVTVALNGRLPIVSTKALFQAFIILSLLASLNGYAEEVTASAQVSAEANPVLAEPADKDAAPLTGAVQQVVQPAVAPTALTAADYLDIQVKPGNNKHKMQEYTVVVNNKQPKHLELLQLEVVNGLSEQTYLQIQQQKAQTGRRVAGGMLRGLTSVATSFVPYAGIGSAAAYHAIGAGANALTNTANIIENTSGSVDYSGRIVQRANNVMVSPNQNFQCMAVTTDKQQPIVKVIFKDLQTNQIYDLQK
jgi:hypothetical protein